MKSDVFVCTLANQVRFEITIKSRVTILYGHSGTGKTKFVRRMGISTRVNPRFDVETINYKPNTNYVGKLKQDPSIKYVFIDEESANDMDRDECLEPILDAGYTMLIVTRKPLINLTYGIQDVYKLQTVSGVTTAVPFYKEYTTLPDSESYACEDSSSGYQYWSGFLDVVTMQGNRNWRKFSDRCLIMDGAAIGAQIRDILDITDNVYLPESFEFLLLNYYLSYTHEDGVRDITSDDKTFERLYTRLVEQENALGFQYSKRSLPLRIKLINLIPELDKYVNKWMQSIMAPLVLKDEDKSANRKELADFLSSVGLQSKFGVVYNELPDKLDISLWKVEVLEVLRELNLY